MPPQDEKAARTHRLRRLLAASMLAAAAAGGALAVTGFEPGLVLDGQAAGNLSARWGMLAGGLLLLAGSIGLYLRLPTSAAARVETPFGTRETTAIGLGEAMDLARVAHWEFDPGRNRFRFDGHFLRLLRAGPETLADGELPPAEYGRRFLHPEDGPRVQDMLGRCLEDPDPGRPHEDQVRVRCADGTVRWMMLRVVRTVSPEHGEPLVSGMLIDLDDRHRMEERLRMFGSVIEHSGQGIAIAGMDGTLDYMNPALRRLVGVGPQEDCRRYRIRDFFHQADRARLRNEVSQVLAGLGMWTGEMDLVTRHGTVVTTLNHLFPVRDATGGSIAVAGIVADLTERKQADTQLRLFANVFAHSGEAILVTDSANRIIAVNESFTRLTGYGPEEAIGEDPRILAAGRLSEDAYRTMWRAIQSEGYWAGEIWDRRKDGSCYPKWLTITVLKDAEGRITHHIGIFTDISERKATEERIRHLAHHDSLTGLPNRFDLDGRLHQAVAAARRDGRALAVMFLDLDRFKAINDSLGHKVGDTLLIEVAERLRGCVRDSDVVARLGGDEFVIVMTGITGDPAKTAASMADKIVHHLGQPYALGEHTLHTTPSIGVSLFPTDGEDVDGLMKNADTAMYHAKAHGRNHFRFFDEGMNRAAAARLDLETSLREALRNGNFILQYQPQVSLADRRVVAVEALVRWADPRRGLVAPGQFIPVAEETGLIAPLGLWVLRAACREIRAFRDAGLGELVVAVNLSARQLGDGTLVDAVQAALEEFALPPSCLDLEITESVAMHDPEAVIAVLKRLRAHGVTLSIDDFGTGYSSLAYLKRFPIHRLKLDRSFVADIASDPNDAAICAATTALAHSLGLQVVAEGVETADQLARVAELGVDIGQGYFFSRPLDPAQVVAASRGNRPAGDSVLYW
ncbi:MAG: EAL domain-containing protein [Rhodocyclaceae bacterium]|nr:EAL domain-containing protein [Rhodocyclaceae bacterium]